MEGVPRMPMLEVDLKQNFYDYSASDWAVSPNENMHEATQQQIVESLKNVNDLCVSYFFFTNINRYNNSIDRMHRKVTLDTLRFAAHPI